MRKDQIPCKKDCPRRKPGCHARCQSYISWDEKEKKKKEKQRKDSEMGAFYRHHNNRYEKQAKRHRK